MNIENKTKLDVIEEKLCKEIEWYLSDEIPLKEKQAKIERLKGYPYAIQTEVSKKLESQIKSEAIKEFAERLKEKSFKTIRNYGLTKDVVEVCDIDNLVKEMVGEKE